MKHLNVKLSLCHPAAKVPQYQTEGSACFDLHAVIEDPTGVTIEPHGTVVIGTGLKIDMPVGYRLDLYGRSGHWFKHRVRVGNCVGKVDADFRAEIMVSLHNEGPKPYTVMPGERIAQGEINEVIRAAFDVVDESELSVTARGEGGLGSTGKQ